MDKTRRNHYVPQWYQKRFLFDQKRGELEYLKLEPKIIQLPGGKKKIVTDINRFSPSKCFYQTDLYTTFFATGPNDEIERLLFGAIDDSGASALTAFATGNEPDWHEHFSNLFTYMDAQRIRTPKGLSWIRAHYPHLDQLQLMIEMQALRTFHCTFWAEAVREVVSAENSATKFIVSDNPVTFYNPLKPPQSADCIIPNDPSPVLQGTRTIFPLDMNHCLILTHYEYANKPDVLAAQHERTHARNFRNTMVRTDALIRTRYLSESEVIQLNYILKSRAHKFIAAAKKDWLFPENKTVPDWQRLDHVLRPPQDELHHWGGEMFIGYDNGETRFQDAFGRTQPENKYLKKQKNRKLGPNDRCGCGSALKYKKCCMHILESQRPTWDVLSIRERNLTLLNGIISIFGLESGKSWDDVRREISDEHIRKLYELYGFLWPLDTNLSSLLPKPDGRSRALYTGIIHADTVTTSITSISPYFDEIIIQSPFMNPWTLNTEFNPMKSPQKFKAQTLKDIAFFLTVAPFIEAGYINLIPDPCGLDPHLQREMIAMAESRLRNYSIPEEDEKWMHDLAQRDAERAILTGSLDMHIAHIKKMHPDADEKLIKDILRVMALKRQRDRLCLLQDSVLQESGQILLSHMTPNFEMALYLAQITGSIVITDRRSRWNELLAAQQRENGLVNTNWQDLIRFLREKTIELTSDHNISFNERSTGVQYELRGCIRELIKSVSTIQLPTEGDKEKVKAQFNDAFHKMRKISTNENDFSFKGKMTCIIPKGGIVDNNVQRLLLSTTMKKHSVGIPMAILLEYS